MQDRTLHHFQGKWITTDEFFNLPPKNPFHRQLGAVPTDPSAHQNRHILFRKRFVCTNPLEQATLYLSADDHYKLWINGNWVAEGPAPAYHFAYNYN